MYDYIYNLQCIYITACRDSNLYLHLWCTCKLIKYEMLVVFNACLVLRGLKTTSKYSQVFKYLQYLTKDLRTSMSTHICICVLLYLSASTNALIYVYLLYLSTSTCTNTLN